MELPLVQEEPGTDGQSLLGSSEAVEVAGALENCGAPPPSPSPEVESMAEGSGQKEQ